jgi:hypothetical protein
VRFLSRHEKVILIFVIGKTLRKLTVCDINRFFYAIEIQGKSKTCRLKNLNVNLFRKCASDSREIMYCERKLILTFNVREISILKSDNKIMNANHAFFIWLEFESIF